MNRVVATRLLRAVKLFKFGKLAQQLHVDLVGLLGEDRLASLRNLKIPVTWVVKQPRPLEVIACPSKSVIEDGCESACQHLLALGYS
jgi:hypothetical protein